MFITPDHSVVCNATRIHRQICLLAVIKLVSALMNDSIVPQDNEGRS